MKGKRLNCRAIQRSLVVVLTIICANAVCGRGRAARTNAGLRPGALRGSNLLLITIDTLRADRVGAYGGGRLTPALDRLAAGGIRLSRAYGHAPLTLPAHASILTGLVPATHGVRNNGSYALDPRPRTLAEQLRQAGYRTAAFVGAFVLDARFGLNRGFDVYDDKIGSDKGTLTFAVTKRSADRVTKLAGDWIAGNRQATQGTTASNPWFVWIHLFDPHTPYNAPLQLAPDPYDNEVAYTDAKLGALFDQLRATGQLDHTLVIVLADHGESLGEHGELTHGLFAYNATLRIPMIISGPGIHQEIMETPIAQIDVLPTTLDLLGVEIPSPIDGHSGLPAIRGEDVPDYPIYFEALDAYLTRNWAPLTGVIADGWKYIELPEPELYDLERDPGELNNLAGREPGRMAALQRRLAGWSPPSLALARPRMEPIDADAAARLRSLGYAAGQPSPAPRKQFGVSDDPKRLLDLDRRYERALIASGEGRQEEAAALLRTVVAERPDFTMAYMNLASVLIASGHPREAVKALEDVAKRGIETPEVQSRLGAAYLAAGDPARASAVLEPLVSRGAGGLDAVTALGVALSEQGQHDRARHLFEQVLQQSPGSASAWNNLGLLELADHRPRDAARAFERAVGADPEFEQAWRGLGAARVQWDVQGATDAWRRATTLAPNDYDTLFNLAVVLWEHGRRADARPYVERFVREAPPARYSREIAAFRTWLAQ
jgi:arylsulfatase A-like enzyme/Flp pilus assembly protein TadD